MFMCVQKNHYAKEALAKKRQQSFIANYMYFPTRRILGAIEYVD